MNACLLAIRKYLTTEKTFIGQQMGLVTRFGLLVVYICCSVKNSRYLSHADL